MPRAQHLEFLHDSKKPQLRPQLPQLLSSLVVLVSQPSTALPLQLAYPEAQLKVQPPPAQTVELVLGRAGQTLPQVLQLRGSLLVLDSQPSLELMLQSRNGLEQESTRQAPPLQVPLPLVIEQRLPHVPQLFRSLAVLVSQPSAALPLQSPKPLLQV